MDKHWEGLLNWQCSWLIQYLSLFATYWYEICKGKDTSAIRNVAAMKILLVEYVVDEVILRAVCWWWTAKWHKMGKHHAVKNLNKE